MRIDIKEERDIREDLDIDRFNLEVENEKNPCLVYYWSKQLSKEQRELADLKVRLKVKRADKMLFYKKNPLDRITKPSNDIVQAMVDKDKEVVSLEYEKNQKEFDVNTLAGAEKSMDNRRSALKNLTELYNKNYYSYPEASRRSKIDDKLDRQRAMLNEKKEK